ncbi:FCD domain-containing protein [Brucella melitensis]|uniref:FCD domain-containing protein n=1 Tax=Brucella melitensis TaxID=29459 RepID=UPI0013656E5F|nr:GntR family transcriptional regulator [Brucella melitensis]MWC41979.1 FCD domain-containing protein [Brucella melitensis]
MNVIKALDALQQEKSDGSPAAEVGEVLSNAVYTTLKSQLMQAQLLPLQRLKVREVAKVLGTSETPVREALQTNFDFHFKLYRLSGMQHLLDMLEVLWMRTGPILSELYPHAMPAYAGPHQHEVVLNALRERDSYALRMAIRMDLIEGGAALIRHLKSATG